ncbi:MAG: GAF domain-containing protein, partial [Synechococcaceae bacterium WB4_1_0192]|nr:GAF domain-containing protein [Synechococcaceae bacterium WB4_1_0192]
MSTTPHCDPLADEPGRLEELQSFAVLDTPADPSLDDISELARRVAGTETAIISLVDQDRQWFKSCVGEALGAEQTPRSVSFCSHTILQRDPLILPDALADERFARNPLVNGGPRIRFYAGFPLISTKGYAVGSLCVISRQPHHLNPDQIDSLRRLAHLTVLHLSHLREVARL